MSSKREVQALIRRLRHAEGWRIEDRGDRWFVYPPDRALGFVVIHKTPSDHRAWRNARAELRRRGFEA